MVKRKTSPKKRTSSKKPKKNKSELWKKINQLSKGDEKNKLEAVELLVKNYKEFEPKKYLPIFEKLASSKNSKPVQLKIAQFLLNTPITVGIYRTLIKSLVKDKDPEIVALTNKIILNRFAKISSVPMLGLGKSLDNIAKLGRVSGRLGLGKSLDNIVKLQKSSSMLGLNKSLENIAKLQKSSSMLGLNKSLENIAKLQKSSSMLGLNKSLENIAKLGSLSSLGLEKTQLAKLSHQLDFAPPKQFINAITLSDAVHRQLNSKVVKNFPSFYQPTELEVVEKPVKKIKKSKSQELVEKLKKCKMGKKYWKEYEDVCKEILEYCLSPPLDAPLYQEYTENRIHRRDIIFLITHGLGAYWQYVISTYGEGIIFDCKNYAKTLPENEIHITEKYLSKKKLTTYGIIISRKGFSKNATIAQKTIWEQHDNMIISLTDEDLIKMLELKDNKGEPWKVLDNITKKFRLGL